MSTQIRPRGDTLNWSSTGASLSPPRLTNFCCAATATGAASSTSTPALSARRPFTSTWPAMINRAAFSRVGASPRVTSVKSRRSLALGFAFTTALGGAAARGGRAGVAWEPPRLLGTLFTPSPFYDQRSGRIRAPHGIGLVLKSLRTNGVPSRAGRPRLTAFNAVSRGAKVAQGVTALQYTGKRYTRKPSEKIRDPGSAPGRGPGARPQQQDQPHPRQEASDVREPGHPPARAERAKAAQDLYDHPEPEHEERGNPHEPPEEAEDQQGQHVRVREQQKVRAEHTRDRAAGPDHRHGRL